MAPGHLLWDQEELFGRKNQVQKISWDCPFKRIRIHLKTLLYRGNQILVSTADPKTSFSLKKFRLKEREGTTKMIYFLYISNLVNFMGVDIWLASAKDDPDSLNSIGGQRYWLRYIRYRYSLVRYHSKNITLTTLDLIMISDLSRNWYQSSVWYQTKQMPLKSISILSYFYIKIFICLTKIS